MSADSRPHSDSPHDDATRPTKGPDGRTAGERAASNGSDKEPAPSVAEVIVALAYASGIKLASDPGGEEFYGRVPARLVDGRAVCVGPVSLAGKAKITDRPLDDLKHVAEVRLAALPPRAGLHHRTYRLRSTAFKQWLRATYFAETKKVAKADAVRDAVAVLEALALAGEERQEAAVRVGAHGEAIYLDLGDDTWRAVEITAEGWRVVNDPPVWFVRPRGMRPLPEPDQRGTLSDLRPFVNCGSDYQWVLTCGWLVMAFHRCGPFPFLAVHGEQGSAKSSFCRVLRRAIDPNEADLRSSPRDVRDLMISAQNGLILAFDNFSSISGDFSDALCRISTGGGFATRALYSDDEEKIFQAKRPVLFNGIPELATRPDLLDRTVVLVLPRIDEEDRQDESEFWEEYDAALPRILGGILSAVATALRRLPALRFGRLPRMADFAKWAAAAEPAFGVPEGTFLKAYTRNREEASETVLEVFSIVPPLRQLLADHGGSWSGTAKLLKEALEAYAGDASRYQDWPKRPHVLSNQLGRLAPSLRATGIDIEFVRLDDRNRTRQIRVTSRELPPSVPSVRSVQPDSEPPRAPEASDDSAEESETSTLDEGRDPSPDAPDAPDGRNPATGDDWMEI